MSMQLHVDSLPGSDGDARRPILSPADYPHVVACSLLNLVAVTFWQAYTVRFLADRTNSHSYAEHCCVRLSVVCNVYVFLYCAG